MSRLSGFFGLQQAGDEAIRLVRLMLVFMPAMAAAFMLSTTFWMIYIAESLGGGDYMAGLRMVGVLVVIQLLVQTVLDYPSGVMGDYIGQRYVIATALICYGLAFWTASTVSESSPFVYFVIIYVLMGIGQSQESGAWLSWFDNNYRVAMPHDRDRKMYGMMTGRMGMVFQVISTLVLLPGAWLAVMFSRVAVFRLQAVLSLVLAVAVLRLIKDLPEAEVLRRQQRAAAGGYRKTFSDGLSFLVSNRFVLFVFTGEMLLAATGLVWWQIVLFPFYFVYLLTDVAVSGFRTLVFIPNAISQERSGIWSRRFDAVKWVPRFRLLQFGGFVFYALLAMTTYLLVPPGIGSAQLVAVFIPLTNIPLFEVPVQSVPALILIFIIFTIGDFMGGFAEVLSQRIMIDVIPNRLRNSMYSLRPTLSIICAIFLIPLFSWLLPTHGLSWTFSVMAVVALLGTLLVRHGYSYPISPQRDIMAQESQSIQSASADEPLDTDSSSEERVSMD